MRTYRTTPRTTRPRTGLLAATGVALAAPSLTACQNGTGTKDEGAAQTPAAVTTAKPSAADAPAPAAQPTEPAKPTKVAAPKAPENRAFCNGSHTTVTAQPAQDRVVRQRNSFVLIGTDSY